MVYTNLFPRFHEVFEDVFWLIQTGNGCQTFFTISHVNPYVTNGSPRLAIELLAEFF